MVNTNSPLVTYTNITKNKTSPRNHEIDTITIHCIVGQWTAKQGCDYFATTDRQCSANYVVGKDGSIGLSVDEKDRSWCSSSKTNDHRAITIEVASDTKHPYAVTDAAYKALIELLVDICKRNYIKKLVWSTEKDDRVNHRNGCNMTVHRDFANKSCPGEYLYSRHADIAAKVNARLNPEPERKYLYRVQVGAYSKEENAKKMLEKLKATGYDAIIKAEEIKK
jgi:N-acetyl-anhydromuramyl-L-alanine amidase AmpD